jgi:tRNA pseudouridine(38-40) synthase
MVDFRIIKLAHFLSPFWLGSRTRQPYSLNSFQSPQLRNFHPLPQKDSTLPIKRKVAIVLCYVGTNYSGLQFNSNASKESVESVVESALHKIGCIRDSNFRQLQKSGWSRSSRTDKGVHAARIIVSAKLELSHQSVSNSDGNLTMLLFELNNVLPADIRALACHRVTKSFRARNACCWRGILPDYFALMFDG